MKQRLLLCISFVLTLMFCSSDLTASVRRIPSYEKYIKQYANLAQKEQKKYGIPASITLAQGILESGAGKSSLARESNNHFGIKCHSEWRGKRTYKNDDYANECFRVYRKVEESFEDHSQFLLKKRYQKLFLLETTDYIGWAKGLQKYGYATDRAYANRLIKIIEDYELYRYDKGYKPTIKEKKRKGIKETQHTVVLREVYKTHGLIYVLANENDTFETIGRDMRFKGKKLAKYNDAPLNFPLKKGDIIYLERKHNKANKPYYDHVVQIGESMHSIAQLYGIKMKNLYRMNKKKYDYIPEEGDVLRLR